MTGSKSLLIALISCGLGAGTLQIVHAATSAGPAGVQKLDDDSYPHMRQALRDLRTAKDSLLAAEPKFHDHRARAIELTNQAIQECETALAEG